MIGIFNYSIKEIPIIFKDRAKGESKIPKLEILRTLKNLIILFFKSNSLILKKQLDSRSESRSTHD